jgi:TatD DNase family protein
VDRSSPAYKGRRLDHFFESHPLLVGGITGVLTQWLKHDVSGACFTQRLTCGEKRARGWAPVLVPSPHGRCDIIHFSMYVDSHAHIEGSEFDVDREAVIQRALDAGVEIIVCVGDGEVAANSHAAAFRVAEEYPFIYTTVGVHPHEASLLDDNLFATLMDLSQHPKVIAWGEIGLDYHYDNSPREVQREAFRRQLRMARERQLPISIHTREAESDTLNILDEEWTDAGLGGVIHCFTGTRAFADAAVERGFLISFSGVITFKTADDLRVTAKHLPLDALLIETDSPFLAPVPYRGRRNEPAYVVETARAIAELRGVEPERIGLATSDNFKRLFKLP